MSFVAALGQAIDFLWKAAKAYAATPDGDKELQDVLNALDLDLNSAPEQTTSTSGESTVSRVTPKSYRG